MLSLFCGVGGLDLGFMQAGYSPIGAFDIWRTAIEVYRSNLSRDAHVLDLSTNDVPIQDNPDVVIAGSPCQGFSVIGRRRIDDPRNSLYVRAARIAVDAEPQAIVLENVPGVLAGKHKGYYNEVVRILESAKFIVHHVGLSAQDAGLPQRRKRVFLVATKVLRSLDIQSTSTCKNVGNVISGSEPQENHDPIILDPHSQDYEIARTIRPGQKLCDVRGGTSSVHSWDIPQVFGSTTRRQRAILIAIMRLRRRLRERVNGDADPVPMSTLRKQFCSDISRELESLMCKGYLKAFDARIDLARRFNGKFRRLQSDGISNAVDTRFGDPRYFLHPNEARGLSAREAARIQGFPDSFHFTGTRSEQFRMIGNAVPVPMGRMVANAVKGALRN